MKDTWLKSKFEGILHGNCRINVFGGIFIWFEDEEVVIWLCVGVWVIVWLKSKMPSHSVSRYKVLKIWQTNEVRMSVFKSNDFKIFNQISSGSDLEKVSSKKDEGGYAFVLEWNEQ